jgi:acyl-CoA thioester hydrolase
LENKILLNKIDLSIKWTDLDPYNHLNNSKYFDFMTEARAKLFWEYSLNSKTQLILHECNIIFKKPYHYPNSIILEQYIDKIDGASFDLKYIFKSPNNELVHAESLVKMVTFDPEKNRVCRVPKEIINILEMRNEA